MTGTAYQLLQLAGTLAAGAGAVFAWQFVLAYRQVDWHKYQAGRHLMSFTQGLAVILTYVVIFAVLAQLVAPDFQPTGVLMRRNEVLGLVAAASRAVIFGWLAWQLWDRLQMLERYQNGYRDDTREGAEVDSSG